MNPLNPDGNMSIEAKVAETILEKGVRVKLPAPFFLPFRKTIAVTFHQPTLRTLLKVASIALRSGFQLEKLTGDVETAHKAVVDHTPAVVKIVATLMLNGRIRSAVFQRILEWWLINNLTARKLGEITLVTVAFSGVQDFTTSIRLIGTMRVTAPKNLSQDLRGSQQGEPSA
jgi:hypothetical protein